MSYHLMTGWKEVIEEDYDTLDEAVERADDLVRMHPDAVVIVNSAGLSLTRYAVKEEVPA